MPEQAAHRAGVVLARLKQALTVLPPGEAPALWPRDRIRAYLEQLLAFADARRRTNDVDERAAILIRQKLDLLEELTDIPAYEPGWTHGDYHWRNILFNDDDEVAGIIDFDTVAYFSPARDVMRGIALSFPNLGPSAFSFFEGYAGERGLSAEQARGYVAFSRYISSYRVWPAAHRYLEPETYDSRWDDLIVPFPDWDWTMLSDRFAEIAARAAGRANGRL
jgi:Ser/Thr protein kinase RdoA (MazF antagonist)